MEYKNTQHYRKGLSYTIPNEFTEAVFRNWYVTQSTEIHV